jgi:hypothetical protein
MTPLKLPLRRVAAALLLLGGCASPSQSPRVAARPPREARASDSESAKLLLISAVYGSGDKFADVTYRVNDLLRDPETVFWARPQWLGADPTPGWNKALVIVYEHDGRRKVFTTGEGGEVGVERLIGETPTSVKSEEAKPKKPRNPSVRKEKPASIDMRPSDPATWMKLEVLEALPTGRPVVRVEGRHFLKTGFVAWTEGLRLEEVELAGGYVNRGAVVIEVLVFRDGEEIFSGVGPVRRPRFEGERIEPKPKPEAPLLQPGDRVVARDVMG